MGEIVYIIAYIGIYGVDRYLCMVRGECGGRVGIVQSKVVVWEQVLNALQVWEPRRPPPCAAAADQPLILRQTFDLK